MCFHGITESEHEDCEQLVLDILHHAGLALHPRAIERAHRLGPSLRGKTRPIIVKFLHFKDRDAIWGKFGHGAIPPKFNRLHVREDFPPKIESNRTQLLPIAIAASKKKDPTTNRPPKTHLVMDRLYINNEKYTVQTLHRLSRFTQATSYLHPH